MPARGGDADRGRAAAPPAGPVDDWLEEQGIVPPHAGDAIADVARVRGLLIAAARREEVVSYSDLLSQLGHRFTRPRMRALCRTLDAVDRHGAGAGEPALAVLVVRESDGLPGQGWWVGSAARGYHGAWTGPDATAHVRTLQAQAFLYWRGPAADA